MQYPHKTIESYIWLATDRALRYSRIIGTVTGSSRACVHRRLLAQCTECRGLSETVRPSR
jgi:hypothetical protein